MHVKRKGLALGLWLASFILSMSILRLNFGYVGFLNLDFFSRLPFIGMAFLLSLGLVCIGTICLVDDNTLWLIPLGLGSVFLIGFAYSQYPTLSSWDTFYHGTASNLILTGGHIGPYVGYLQYPGAFLIWSIFATMTGIQLFDAGLLLSSVVNFLLILILLVIGNRLLTRRFGWLVPCVFLSLNFWLYPSGLHYSPMDTALSFSMLAIFLALLPRSGTPRTTMLFIVFIAATMTEVFQSVFILALFLSIFLLQGAFRHSKEIRMPDIQGGTFIPLLAVFVVWNIFVSAQTAGTGLQVLLSVLAGSRSAIAVAGAFYKIQNSFYLEFLQLYKYLLYFVIGSVALYELIFVRPKKMILLSAGIILASLLTLLVLSFVTPLSDLGAEWMVSLGSIPVSILVASRIGQVRRNLVRVSKFVLPILVITAFIVGNVGVSQYIIFMHQDEIQATSFLYHTEPPGVSVSFLMMFQDAQVYGYYANAYPGLSTNFNVIQGTETTNQLLTLINHNDIFLDNIPRLTYYFGMGYVTQPRLALVYSSSLDRIYCSVC